MPRTKTLLPEKLDSFTSNFKKQDNLATFSRPMRRIVIYAKHADGGKFIDVSLKHFVAADVRRLMKLIHERRPDLAVPVKWL